MVEKRRRQRTIEHTRQELLAAGRQFVLDHGMTTPLPIRLKEVAESIGHTSGAGYYQWKDQTVFQRQLTEDLLRRLPLQPPDIAAHATLDRAVAAIVTALLDQRTSDASFSLQLHFVAVSLHDEEVRAWLRSRRRAERDALAIVVRATMEQFGLQPAPPCTCDDVVGALAALLDGYAIRSLTDDNTSAPRLSIDVSVTAATALILGLTSLVQSKGTRQRRPAQP